MTTVPLPYAEYTALQYFGAGSGEAWRWAEGVEVLAWNADEGTVAFREELVAILGSLASRGLPTFPALVLLLAACRGRTLTLGEALGSVEILSLSEDEKSLLRRQRHQRGAEILAALEAVSRWPRELLANFRAKASLAEMVFERNRQTARSPAQAREIVATLRDGGLTNAALNHPTGRRVSYVNALFELQGILKVTPELLTRRLRTGLDEPPAPASLPEEALPPPADLARRLLEQLQKQPEHAALARAARDLLAALSLPRRLPETDEAVQGGAADLSNRGSLDKLLLSELAHDDLTLATRVALNEALYLRHETPATPQSAGLALLLDSGVRLWGVPRVFATAAALALGAADSKRPALQAWRADGRHVQPVDLLSAEGLQLHLGALATEPHPGAALAAFVKALEMVDVPGTPAQENPETEAVILTHRDAFADPAFRRALDAQPLPASLRLFVGTVDRAGTFELTRYPPTGTAPLCRVHIRLDDIQRPSAPGAAPSSTPLLDPRWPKDLPVILALSRLPFLLPVREKITAFYRTDAGITYAATQTHQLLAWKDPAHGAETLTGDLPPGRTILLRPGTEDTRIYALTARWREGKIPLAAYDLETGELRTIDLAVPAPPVDARLEAGVIFLFYPGRINVFRLSDGQELGRMPATGLWKHGRYYRQASPQGSQWFYAAWNGLEVGMGQVHGEVNTARMIFDREGQPGPWLLTEAGEVRHLESGARVFSFGQPLEPTDQIHISRDGHHIRVISRETQTLRYVHLQQSRPTLRTLPVVNPAKFTEDTLPLVTPQYPLMTHFSHVCVLPEGNLALRSSRGRLFEFVQRDGKVLWQPSRLASLGGMRERSFQPQPLPEGSVYELKSASWPGGSRAFLDGRGLLHLKSVDPALPEISLVLANAPGAIWSSDGRMTGAKFFLGPDRVPAALDELLRLLERFCEPLR